MSIDDLLDAWRVNNAINREMLDQCSDEDLDLKPGKGKTVRSNYVHIIGIRRAWAEDKLKKEAALVPKLDWQTTTRQELEDGLESSSELMAKLFRHMDSAPKPGRMSLVKFFAYCVAHEANHRAQIELAWRLNGREPDNAVLYRFWEWGKK